MTALFRTMKSAPKEMWSKLKESRLLVVPATRKVDRQKLHLHFRQQGVSSCSLTLDILPKSSEKRLTMHCPRFTCFGTVRVEAYPADGDLLLCPNCKSRFDWRTG